MIENYVFIVIRPDKTIHSVWLSKLKAERAKELTDRKVVKRKIRDA